MRFRVALAVAAGVAASLAAPAAAPASATGPDTLFRGQSLQFGADSTLFSPSGVYALSVLSLSAEVDQTVPVDRGRSTVAAPTWTTPQPRSNSGTDHTVLTMQTDGNLVLYSQARHALWSSRTAGTAAERLVMQDDGNLVLYTATNHAVWATHSGPALLGAGQTLRSGRALLNRVNNLHGGPATRLAMQTDGNLVVYFGSRATWSSRTKVAGSRLVMQTDGNLVVYTPHGRALWSSRTAGSGASTWLYAEQCGYATVTSLPHGRVWQSNPGPVNGC